jgi:phospho-2-dehydro-3-deoxyheptonate aldolase
MGQGTQELLVQHWGMDKMAADALATVVTPAEEERFIEIAESIPSADAARRNSHRLLIADSFAGRSGRKVFIEGPCSIDETTPYEELFDVLCYVQDEHPDATLGTRIVGDKSRTTVGWRGPAYSLNPKERARLHEVHREAMDRGLPVFSEVSAGHELGEYAPYMSGFWLGALGMTSTALRSDTTLFNGLPVAIKSSPDGSVDMVRNAVLAVRATTETNNGSGVNIGTIASTPDQRGIPTGILPVGVGNNHAAIIARGYALPKGTSSEVGTRLAIEHISDLCRLAKELGSVVLIDKTHATPVMIGLDRKDSNRLVAVSSTIQEALEAGEIEDAEYLGGEVAEVSTQVGRTDPNYIVSWKNRAEYSEMIGRALMAA